jgi:hypothetical protein
MDADRKRKCEAMWAEAQQLQGKFKTKEDKSAITWNSIRNYTPWFQQQYRGEVFQAMLRNRGRVDVEFRNGVVGAAGKDQPRYACELVGFLNASYMNGELNVYDAPPSNRQRRS